MLIRKEFPGVDDAEIISLDGGIVHERLEPRLIACVCQGEFPAGRGIRKAELIRAEFVSG